MTVSMKMLKGKKVFFGTILIVEDEPEIREELAKTLRVRNHVVVEESNGVAAASRAFLEKPDLVLLDFRLPGLHGCQVCKAIRDDPATEMIPVIMMTIAKDSHSRILALEAGANDFLQKPFQKEDLLARTQSLLQMKWLHDELNRQNQRLEEQIHARAIQLKATTRQLDAVHDEILYRLSLAAEFKDKTAPGHLKRIQRFVAIIAKALGLVDEEVNLISRASVLHDIGKMGIPESILLKRGPLTEKERNIIEMHPMIGGEILAKSESDLLQFAEAIARTHHERHDGRGYPLGLRDDEIPLAGKIVAVADVFDALTPERSYKTAQSFDKSLKEIESEKGGHFSDDIVQVFLDVSDEIKMANREILEAEEDSLRNVFPVLEEKEYQTDDA